jgi:hypothetical protein
MDMDMDMDMDTDTNTKMSLQPAKPNIYMRLAFTCFRNKHSLVLNPSWLNILYVSWVVTLSYTSPSSRMYITISIMVSVADKGNEGQSACQEEWKKCKEEHE